MFCKKNRFTNWSSAVKLFNYLTKTTVFRFDLDWQPDLADIQQALFAVFTEKNSQAKIYWQNERCDLRFRLVLSEGTSGEIICQLDLCVDGSYLPVWTSYEMDLTKLCQNLEISVREAENLINRDCTPFITTSGRQPMTFSGVESCFVSERQDSGLDHFIAFKMLINEQSGSSRADNAVCAGEPSLCTK